MFCTNCGSQLPGASARCLKCGAGQGQGATSSAVPSPNPDNYLVAAILLCLCWCLPLGIVSLVYAAKGSGLMQAGRIAEAAEYGAKARLWAWIGFGTGLVVILGYAVLLMIGVASE